MRKVFGFLGDLFSSIPLLAILIVVLAFAAIACGASEAQARGWLREHIGNLIHKAGDVFHASADNAQARAANGVFGARAARRAAYGGCSGAAASGCSGSAAAGCSGSAMAVGSSTTVTRTRTTTVQRGMPVEAKPAATEKKAAPAKKTPVRAPAAPEGVSTDGAWSVDIQTVAGPELNAVRPPQAPARP